MTDSLDVVVLPAFGRPSNLRQRVSRGLRAAVSSGSLKPGQVYSVPVLATEFGVSATPVREAMLDLARDRLVEAVPNRGFRILDVTPEELAEVNEVRMLIEPACFASLAGKLSSLELEGLRAYVDAIILQHGRVQSGVVFTSLGRPVGQADELGLAGLVAGRMARANRPKGPTA